MAWDDAAKKLAIKAIGTVESNLRYDAVNYNDPITIGIMQWYGPRAADLMEKIRDANPTLFAGVAVSLRNDLTAHPAPSSKFWANRDLTRAEGESLRPILTSDTGVQTQNALTISDLEDYRVAAAARSLTAETNTVAFIYWAMLYHQSPLNANRVLNLAGYEPSIARLHAMALNNDWYRDYPTRLNTAKAIIESGDNSGVPEWGTEPIEPAPGGDAGSAPDEGTPGDPTGPSGVSQVSGGLRYVQLVGTALHVHTAAGTVICERTPQGDLWQPGTLSQPDAGPEIPDATPPPEPPVVPPGDPGVAEALVQFLISRIAHYDYTQGAGRNDPDNSGKTDCSALQNFAYRTVAGITLGGDTITQNRKDGVLVWSNLPGNSFGAGPGDIPPLSVMQKADLCYSAKDTNFTRVRHVEMYMGPDHGNQLIGWGGWEGGHPSGKGPFIRPNYNTYMNNQRWHSIKRIL